MIFLFKNANKIFGGDIKLHFLVFFSASNDEIAPGINEAAITAAKDFKGKVCDFAYLVVMSKCGHVRMYV